MDKKATRNIVLQSMDYNLKVMSNITQNKHYTLSYIAAFNNLKSVKIMRKTFNVLQIYFANLMSRTTNMLWLYFTRESVEWTYCGAAEHDVCKSNYDVSNYYIQTLFFKYIKESDVAIKSTYLFFYYLYFLEISSWFLCLK